MTRLNATLPYAAKRSSHKASRPVSSSSSNMSTSDKSKLNERSVLRERLVSLRRDLAFQHGKEDKVYLIFNNATLDDLVLKMPRSEKTLMQITGIKEKKFEMYGAAIIDVIREYNKEFNPPAPRKPRGEKNDLNVGVAAKMRMNGATSMNIHVSVSTDASRDPRGPTKAPKRASATTSDAPLRKGKAATKKPPPKAKKLAKFPPMSKGESYPPRISKAMTIAELKEEASCRNLEKKSLPKTKPELLHHLVSGSIRLGRAHEFQQFHEAQNSKMSFHQFEAVRQTYHGLLERMEKEKKGLLKTSLAELKGEQAKKDAGKQKAFEEWAKTRGGFGIPTHFHPEEIPGHPGRFIKSEDYSGRSVKAESDYYNRHEDEYGRYGGSHLRGVTSDSPYDESEAESNYHGHDVKSEYESNQDDGYGDHPDHHGSSSYMY